MTKKPKAAHVYSAADGAGYNDEQAAIIGVELEKLGSSLTPNIIVDAARLESSRLHPFFEWDNRQAANKYRVFQARNIVNHLQIMIVTKEGIEQPIKAYYSQDVATSGEDGDVSERRYLHIDLVRSTPGIARQVVEDAKQELLDWQERYRQYHKAFSPVFIAIRKIL